jgi:hypothetical protein
MINKNTKFDSMKFFIFGVLIYAAGLVIYITGKFIKILSKNDKNT